MTEEPAKITKEYNGHTITLDAEQMRFRVSGPLINEWFSAFRDCRQKIDEAASKHEAQTRKRISLPVLLENGERVKLTGIHAGNGSILGLPGSSGFSSQSFYPDVPWIAETLQVIAKLQDKIKAEQERLAPYRVRSHQTGPRGTHSEKVDRLIELVEQATQAANSARGT